MTQPFRVSGGTGVDPRLPLAFAFDGRSYHGLAGDTLASALLANGVRLVARSFKYHRPRGIVGLGAEEPNALVALRDGARVEPNTRATQVELYEGLVARSQNAWPSLRVDLGALNSVFARLFPAGFYYKTFMWPPSLWMAYERVIRRIAGLGRAPNDADPDRYDMRHEDVDVLVVGAGPAGLMAALTVGRAGGRVLLADENAAPGGSLLHAPPREGGAWLATTLGEIGRLPNIRLVRRGTVFGHYDHGLFAIAERVSDHLPQPASGTPRQRLWKVRARQTILTAGAIERPLVFADNDRPGVMLAAAVRGYLHRYGVLCGRTIAIVTNNDSAYPLALELLGAGARVQALIDLRPQPAAAHALEAAGVRVLAGHAIIGTTGRHALTGATVAPLDGQGRPDPDRGAWMQVDLIAMSGGWTPAIHLHSQGKGRIRFVPDIDAYVPDGGLAGVRSAGACNGAFDHAACLREGRAAGTAAASAAGLPIADPADERAPDAGRVVLGPAIVPGPRGAKRFLDFQNDVTVADIELAAREGYRSVEHAKRYTTLGMGTDQGKLGGLNGLAALAAALGQSAETVGLTTYRPPYTPVTIGTMIGRDTGAFAHPVRRSAAHDWHERNGAAMMNAGLWMRPQFYPRPGEDGARAVAREVGTVRNAVGLVDVSTLGKIEICGADAAELLDRVYTNGWKRLEVGRGRYGVMLREDGFVFDDGVTMRLAPDRFLMTTTTVNADAVAEWLEFLLQTQWPTLLAYVTRVTEQWFAAALNGSSARQVLARLTDDIDTSNASFPLMSIREGTVARLAARVMRISFSGELAYEINVAADDGLSLWEAVLKAGGEFGITAYGIESMGAMRIEKGHVVIGAEADGRVTPDDLGLGAMVSTTKDFIGRRSLRLPGLQGPGRKQLVGLLTADTQAQLPVGAQIVAEARDGPQPSLGHVTSYAFSPSLSRQVALALVKDGRSRMGQTLHATSPTAGITIPVVVTPPRFVDPEGSRMRA